MSFVSKTNKNFFLDLQTFVLLQIDVMAKLFNPDQYNFDTKKMSDIVLN